MRVHFIAIGGSVMHNLALALQKMGHTVTGSDDEIRDPARARLQVAGLLPPQEGWDTARIQPEIDAVILGMHARPDNPELIRARELKLNVYSFPEFIHAQCQHKQRIVIAGSHGKTTITAIIMHVLRETGRDFDYMVGASVPGFDLMVRLSDTAPFIVLEGDEYFASPLDRRPKFLLYEPHIIVVSGVAWDHINVYPTEELYTAQFAELFKALPKAGTCIYNKDERILREFAQKYLKDEYHYACPYTALSYRVRNRQPQVKLERLRIPLRIFGKHNAYNIAAAWEVCKRIAVEPQEFAKALATFSGAAMRLQTVRYDEQQIIIRDFAHAPSKVLASVRAATGTFKFANNIAVLELHTFSSLNKEFLPRYRSTLKKARHRIVFVNQKALAAKNMPPITETDIHTAFRDRKIHFITDKAQLVAKIKSLYKQTQPNMILLMSSGNFDGLDYSEL